MKNITRFLKNESGATAIEYALIISLISLVCIVALTNVGGALRDTFDEVASTLDSAINN